MSKRWKYSREFEQEAVQMVSVHDVALLAVANDLGISEGLLGNWRQDLSKHGDKAFVGEGRAHD
jgi:transposase